MKEGEKYYPFEPDNFAEAMTEATDAQLAKIADLVAKNDHVGVCEATAEVANTYWKKQAELFLYDKAVDQLNEEQGE